jgi:cytochrome P450
MVAHSVPEATKNVPRIKELPFLGSMFAHNNHRLDLYQRVLQQYGDIAGYHYGPFPITQVSSSELVHAVLVEHAGDFDKGDALRQAFTPIIGQGLFISEGTLYRQQRKVMAPTFQPRHVLSYADTMISYAQQIQRGWRDGMILDIGHEMTQVTMSIVGKVLFDADMFTEANELGAALTIVLEQINYGLSHLFPLPLGWPTPRSRRAKKALAVLDGRINKMIAERRAANEEKNDLLSILLRTGEDGSTMSNKQLRDEAITLFAAGHETTATALTWTWYMLATHPEIYQRMREEVDTVLHGRVPTYSDLALLPYTLQVFKEAMRLYPPAYAVTRTALHDLQLAGYSIRRGELVVLPIYAIHRRPDYFPHPEEFNPDRFGAANEKRLPRYAYMPFGAGPRICIGNHFAMMEGHLLLATLAQHVIFEVASETSVEPEPNKTITIRPNHPIKIRVVRRTK